MVTRGTLHTGLATDEELSSLIYETFFYHTALRSYKLLKTFRFFWPRLYNVPHIFHRCSSVGATVIVDHWAFLLLLLLLLLVLIIAVLICLLIFCAYHTLGRVRHMSWKFLSTMLTDSVEALKGYWYFHYYAYVISSIRTLPAAYSYVYIRYTVCNFVVCY